MQTLFQELEDTKDANSGDKAANACAQVLVPFPIDKSYSYKIPEDMEVFPGQCVTVPLGSREVVGVVWDEPSAPDPDLKLDKLKQIISVHDFTPLSGTHRKFIEWVAHYTMSPLGFVLKMTLSVPGALEPPKPIQGYKISDTARAADKDVLYKNLSPQRRKVLDVMRDGVTRRASEIAELAGCSSGVVKGLVEKNLMEPVDVYSQAPCRHPRADFGGVDLSEMQEAAAEHVQEYVRAGEYNVSVLDGVTGAGKTEVYFEAVAAAIEQDKQALIMLPEIALSNAFWARFQKRFGCKPALWHSSLSAGQRKRTWRGVAEGETKVVVGARSALFLPYRDLGLIIIDEEHDPAYKQEDHVIYNARDMAIVRAHLGKFPVSLVSATPSLETITNAWGGRYDHLHLPQRHGAAKMPDIHLVDMKQDKPERQKFIAPSLIETIAETMAKGEQSLLFLNRRGYAPLTVCKSCGYRYECPRCTAWLVEHKRTGRLHCHHCGYATRTPKDCASCGDDDSLIACGPGVERVYEEIKDYFPEARIAVLTSDLMIDHEQMRATLDSIINHDIDIIIGTQIIAKGHHFPLLTCVIVVDSDLGLQGGDLRAAERTFQLLHQVAGRAGRAERPGHVYLQTFIPDNKVMQALTAHDRDVFYDIEAGERDAAHMPPFSRLVGIIVSGKDEQLVLDVARGLGRISPQAAGIRTLGPAEAPLYRLRGNYRRRLLVQADKNLDVQKTVEQWIGSYKVPSSVRVYIDVDPQSFL